jgi:hypothetical protein
MMMIKVRNFIMNTRRKRSKDQQKEEDQQQYGKDSSQNK